MTAVASRANMSTLLADALAQELERDERVFVIGEDVAAMGGVFGATRRLEQRFGAERVRDTPISEAAFIGLAVGAAQAGLRPVVELMFVDFVGVCLDQIANQMAKNHYMSGGAVTVPVVVRTAVGCIGAAGQHSQVLSGLFAHLPGLKVVFPGAPEDAPGLLRAAIADPNPVVFLEHKRLLKTRVGRLPYPGQGGEPAIGAAAIARAGRDVTVAASGWMVQEAVAAADLLGAEGVSVEVVDLRTIVPLDRETLVASVARTGRLLVVDEDYRSFGVSGELVATVCEALPDRRPQVARHAVADVPVPASKPLEEAVIPDAASIAAAVRQLLGGAS